MYREIMVPLEGSDLAERALPCATALAQASSARLILCNRRDNGCARTRTFLGV